MTYRVLATDPLDQQGVDVVGRAQLLRGRAGGQRQGQGQDGE